MSVSSHGVRLPIWPTAQLPHSLSLCFSNFTRSFPVVPRKILPRARDDTSKATHRSHILGNRRSGSQNSTLSTKCASSPNITLRRGRPSDTAVLRGMVWAEKMNPLSISPERFTIAEDASGEIAGCCQLVPLSEDKSLELRSLIVRANARGQGIGSMLITKVLESVGEDNVYLTTLANSKPFYTRFGFQEVPQGKVPRSLLLEVIAGSIVGPLVTGQKLIVMLRPGQQC